MAKARWPHLPFREWIRTCQECGSLQVDLTEPKNRGNQAFCNRKCKNCKSEALDYGNANEIVEQEDEE